MAVRSVFILIAFLFQLASPYACQNNREDIAPAMSCHNEPTQSKSLAFRNGTDQKPECGICLSGICFEQISKPEVEESVFGGDKGSSRSDNVQKSSFDTDKLDRKYLQVQQRAAYNGPPDQFKIQLPKHRHWQAIYQVFLN